MARPIGYYVHHHGDGHRQRALALADSIGERLVLLGTGLAGRTGGVRTIELPDDCLPEQGFAGADGEAHRAQALHFAPIDHDGIRERVAIVSRWIADERPALIVVDVSVEVAMLARLAATPVVYVRLAGLRDDPAHLDAFRAAHALIAPFDEALDDPATPDWVRAKTTYFSGLTAHRSEPAPDAPRDDILVVVGAGGSMIDGPALAAAARATPDRHWRVAGLIEPVSDAPANLQMLGWVDDVAAEIDRATVVIGGGGDGVVSAVLAAGQPFLCLPEARPFDEQRSKARQLRAARAAVVRESWPVAEDWQAVLAETAASATGVGAKLHDPDGPARAAAFLLAMAEQRA
ncbi:glycosyltransferase [Sphingomonas sp. BIUV-7]|uniref:Glycosyltransferase n=1 Tax=Sphingomonas natans TaxID=3063330 RepID=A0ABT8Y9U2_9SPHN|nr:glycosyltransferase [Sphingomonas sp. BIUV-7]MDO6415102.1 glycosyltransferase [Sphingomonas sp. BIUV-7]